MAILKQRLSKRMPDGSLAPVHLETSSDLVLRPDGTTTEANLINLLDKNAEIDAKIAEIEASMPKPSITIAASDTPLYTGTEFTDESNRADYVCDGTNDTTIINNAIKELEALGGGTLYLRPGTYTAKISVGASITTIDKTRRLGNISIVGTGSTHRRKVSTPEYSSTYMDGDTVKVDGTLTVYQTAENVRIVGIEFTGNCSFYGNRSVMTHCTCNELRASEGIEIIVDTCTIIGNAETGVYGTVVRNSKIAAGESTGYAISRLGTDRNGGYAYTHEDLVNTHTTVDFINNVVGKTRVQIGGNICRSAFIVNNEFGPGSGGVDCQVSFDAKDSDNVNGRAVVAMNTITFDSNLDSLGGRIAINVYGYGAVLGELAGDTCNRAIPVYVLYNKITILPGDTVQNVTGIRCPANHSEDDGHICMVVGNTIMVEGDKTSVNVTGISADGGNYTPFSHLAIRDNFMIRCKLAIALRAVSGAIISNNVAFDCINGISLSNFKYSEVVGNIVYRDDTYATGEYAIKAFYGNITGVMIANNITKGSEISVSTSGNTIVNNAT